MGKDKERESLRASDDDGIYQKLIERENKDSCAMACIEIRGGKEHAWENEALDDIFYGDGLLLRPGLYRRKI